MSICTPEEKDKAINYNSLRLVDLYHNSSPDHALSRWLQLNRPLRSWSSSLQVRQRSFRPLYDFCQFGPTIVFLSRSTVPLQANECRWFRATGCRWFRAVRLRWLGEGWNYHSYVRHGRCSNPCWSSGLVPIITLIDRHTCLKASGDSYRERHTHNANRTRHKLGVQVVKLWTKTKASISNPACGIASVLWRRRSGVNDVSRHQMADFKSIREEEYSSPILRSTD